MSTSMGNSNNTSTAQISNIIDDFDEKMNTNWLNSDSNSTILILTIIILIMLKICTSSIKTCDTSLLNEIIMETKMNIKIWIFKLFGNNFYNHNNNINFVK